MICVKIAKEKQQNPTPMHHKTFHFRTRAKYTTQHLSYHIHNLKPCFVLTKNAAITEQLEHKLKNALIF